MFLQLMAHYHPRMWCSSCLEAVIIFFFFGEVSDVPYGKLGVLNHPTHGGGYHLHIGDPGGLILYHTASTHCSYGRFNDHFRLHNFRGTSRAIAGDRSSHRQAVTSLKPRGGATTCSDSRDPDEDEFPFSCPACTCSSTLWY